MPAVSSLRTFFSCFFVSACALRNLTISSCCSFERTKRSLPLFCFCRAWRRCCVICSSASRSACLRCHLRIACASSSFTTMNGRSDAPRLRTPISSSRPANCSITFEKSERLSLMSCGMLPNGVFIMRTQKSSARKSESANSMTEPFPSASALETSFVPSGPFGNAVLNVPARRAARMRSAPSGTMSLTPPPICIAILSVVQEFSFDVTMTGVNVRPAPFVASNANAPANGNITCERRWTRRSPLSMLAGPSDRKAGLSSTPPCPLLSFVAAARSQVIFAVSNVTPHASKSLPRVDGPSMPPICPIIGFCCWRLAIMSLIENGSTHAISLPPRRTNWSIA